MGRTKHAPPQKADPHLTSAKKADLCKRIIHALRNGNHSVAEGYLSGRNGNAIIDFDREEYNSMLYFWAVITDSREAVRFLVIQGGNPNSLVAHPRSAVSPLLDLFSHFGSATFTKPNGEPLEVLHIPVICMGVLAKSEDALDAIGKTGGNPNITIPETGQTPFHIAGLAYACRPVQPLSTVEEGVPSWEAYPSEDGKYVGDDGADSLYVATLGVAEYLLQAGADPFALDKHGRCPVRSCIAAGQMWSAAAMLDAIYEEAHERMDYLSYIKELICVDAPASGTRRKSLELSDNGLEKLLFTIFISFLQDYDDNYEALAKSSAMEGSNKSVAMEIAMLTRLAMKLGSSRMLKWLLQNCHAEEMDYIAVGERGVPLSHLAIRKEYHSCLDVMVEHCDTYLENSKGLLPVMQATKEDCHAYLEAWARKCARKSSPADDKEQLRQRDAGLTPLGHAVVLGSKRAVAALLDCCKVAELDVNKLLDCTLPRSANSPPVFQAVIQKWPELDHQDPAILSMLLEAGLDPEGPAATKHVELSQDGRAVTFLREPSGSSETVNLAMYAAYLGDCQQLEMLLKAGASATISFPNNRHFHNPISMVIDFPDMGGNICGDDWAKLLAAVDCPDGAAQPVPASSLGSGPSTEAAQGEVPVSKALTLVPELMEIMQSMLSSSEPAASLQARYSKLAEAVASKGGLVTPEDFAGMDSASIMTAASQMLEFNKSMRQEVKKKAGGLSSKDSLVEMADSLKPRSKRLERHRAELETLIQEAKDNNVDLDEDAGSPSKPSKPPGEAFSSPTPSDSRPAEEEDKEVSETHMQFWLRDDNPGSRFQCILLLLQNGATLTARQLTKLQTLLEQRGHLADEGRLLKKAAVKVKPCTHCNLCGIFLRCSCKLAWYCGKECQAADWPNHRKLCKATRGRQ